MKTIMNIGGGRLHTGERDHEGVDIVIGNHETAVVSDEVYERIMACDRAAGRNPRIVLVGEPVQPKPEPVAMPEPAPVERGKHVVLSGSWMKDRWHVRDVLKLTDPPKTRKMAEQALKDAGFTFEVAG